MRAGLTIEVYLSALCRATAAVTRARQTFAPCLDPYRRRMAFLTDMSILVYNATKLPLILSRHGRAVVAADVMVSAHGLAAEGSVDDARTPSRLHASTPRDSITVLL